MDLFESIMQGHRELNESRENGLRNFTIEFENPYRRYESETADYQATSPEEALDKFLAEFGEEYRDKIYLIYDESDYEWFIDQKTGELRPTEEFDMYQELDDSPTYFTQEDELNDIFGECVQESTELEEAFSKSLPPEIANTLAKVYWNSPKDALLKKGLDLANLKYVEADPPTSNRDPILKDPNKVCFFILDDNGRETVYIPYYYQTYLFSEGKETNQLPWKVILTHAKKFGYVDLTDPQNTTLDKRKERQSIDRSADRDPKRAQHQRDDGTWVDFASRGYDKNGYKVDSQKYQRMLDTLGEDNYKEVMAKYGDRINSMADRIADLLKDRRNSSNYRNLDYIDSAIRGLRDASSSFEELGKTIDRYYEWSQEDGDEGARFKERYPSLKDYLEHGWSNSAEYLRGVRKELAYAEDNLKKIKDKSESVKVESTDLNEDTVQESFVIKSDYYKANPYIKSYSKETGKKTGYLGYGGRGWVAPESENIMKFETREEAEAAMKKYVYAKYKPQVVEFETIKEDTKKKIVEKFDESDLDNVGRETGVVNYVDKLLVEDPSIDIPTLVLCFAEDYSLTMKEAEDILDYYGIFADYFDQVEEESLREDTVKKKNGKWTNRGDDGKEHGEFNTKKEADKQRKAMFANGYKAEAVDPANTDDYWRIDVLFTGDLLEKDRKNYPDLKFEKSGVDDWCAVFGRHADLEKYVADNFSEDAKDIEFDYAGTLESVKKERS